VEVAELHSRGYKVATAAWTGIAATLLIGGCTVHSLFKLPILLLDTSSYDISPISNYAAMLRGISLFVVDESSMVQVYAFDVIDRDITGMDAPFGSKTFLWGGDFCQVLPVVRHGCPSAIVETVLKAQNFAQDKPTRVHHDEAEFSNWQLNLGNGKLATRHKLPFNGCIQIPAHCVTDSVVTSVYGDDFIWNTNADKVTLCPKNEETLYLMRLY